MESNNADSNSQVTLITSKASHIIHRQKKLAKSTKNVFIAVTLCVAKRQTAVSNTTPCTVLHTYPNIIQKKGATGQLNTFPDTAVSVNSPTIG